MWDDVDLGLATSPNTFVHCASQGLFVCDPGRVVFVVDAQKGRGSNLFEGISGRIRGPWTAFRLGNPVRSTREAYIDPSIKVRISRRGLAALRPTVVFGLLVGG